MFWCDMSTVGHAASDWYKLRKLRKPSHLGPTTFFNFFLQMIIAFVLHDIPRTNLRVECVLMEKTDQVAHMSVSAWRQCGHLVQA